MKNKRFKQIAFNYSDKDIESEVHDYFKLKFDHLVLSEDLDQVQFTLDSLKEAVLRECPNLIVVQDSGSEDDEAMLHEMQRFLAYEDMTTRYVVKENQEEALNDYCKIAGSDFDNLNAALEDAYFSFYKRF